MIIIGAGASLAQAASYRPVHSKEHPPLDANFFSKAADLMDSHPLVRASIEELRDEIDEDGSFDDPWSSRIPLRMEQFFADVYYDVASGRSTSAFAVYLALLRLYAHVIGATTNWIPQRRNSGLLEEFLRNEIQRANPHQPTIITFNQDLLVETAIDRLSRATPSWCLQALYGDVRFHENIEFPNDASAFRHHGSACLHSPPVSLLKLHGSFNWVVRTVARDPKADTLFPRNDDKKIFLLNHRVVLAPPQTMNTGPGAGRRDWYLWPLVVPPIYDKQRITGVTLLDALWRKAAAALRQCERAVVFGYSMPESDVLARQLFRRAYARNAELNSVDVINPDVQVAARLKDNLACHSIRVSNDVATYVDEM